MRGQQQSGFALLRLQLRGVCNQAAAAVVQIRSTASGLVTAASAGHPFTRETYADLVEGRLSGQARRAAAG